MSWFRSAAAIAAIVGVASGGLATGFAGRVTAQETLEDQGALEGLAGREPAEVALLPEDALVGERELDELVAPVALYPDALLAQVLVAATYPLQIVKADRLLDETESLSDEEAAQRIAEQEWDPSVMVLLSGFPTVVRRMAADLDWTERLGTAMLSQDQDVLAAVQRMRTQALDTGWLRSNDAQVVERNDTGVSIRPADPEVVYVPSYDPALAFTSTPTAAPYVAPRSNPLANPVVAGAMAFGAAFLVQQLFNDDDDQDRGWDDYWRRPDPIDWRDRQFYPRPDRGWRSGGGYTWGRERDEHWDRARGGWRYDAAARASRERERRAAVAWTSRPTPEGLGRIGQLRAVAAEPPERFRRPPPKATPPGKRPPAVRSTEGSPPARAERPRPKPVARPAPKPAVAGPAPKPEQAAKPKPAAQKPPAQKPAAQKPSAQKPPTQKPPAQRGPVQTPRAAAASKPEAKPRTPAARGEAKPAARPAIAREEAKPPAKPAVVRTEAKPPAKPADARKEAKPPAKPAVARQEAKPPAKPAVVRNEAQPAAKPAPKPAAVRKPAKAEPKPAVARTQAKPAAKPAIATKAAKPASKPTAGPAPQRAAQKPANAARKPACKRGEKCRRPGG